MGASEVKASKATYFLTLFLVCVIGFSSSYVFIQISRMGDVEVKPLDKMNVIIGIKVYDAQGNLKTSYAKNDDLILDNLRAFLQAWFTSANPSDASLTNTASQSKTVRTRYAGVWTNTYADANTGSSTKGGLIGIGIGTTTPARTNVNLETQKESSVVQDNGFPIWTYATGNITSQGSITATSGYDITEAGFFCRWVDTSGSENVFMLFHDTFGAISVISTDVVVVSYTLNLAETTLNQNFGIWLEGLLSSVSDGSDVSKTFYNTVGGSTSQYVYSSTGGNAANNWLGGVYSCVSPYTYIQIGTSGVAPARNDIVVPSIVESSYAPSPAPSLGTTTIIVRVSVTVTASRSVACAGFSITNQYYTTSPSQKYYLFWHTTFTVVNVPSGQATRVTFTLTC